MPEPLYPVVYIGRPMRCVRCHALVDVIEIPDPWLDPDAYVCGCCLEPVAATSNTLSGESPAGEPEPPAPPTRHLRSVA